MIARYFRNISDTVEIPSGGLHVLILKCGNVLNHIISKLSSNILNGFVQNVSKADAKIFLLIHNLLMLEKMNGLAENISLDALMLYHHVLFMMKMQTFLIKSHSKAYVE